MSRESVPLDRCKECGSVVSVMHHETWLDDRNDVQQAFWTEPLEHNRKDCQRMVLLAREEWPTLW